MKSKLPDLAALLLLLPLYLHAGSVIKISDGTEIDGKITLNPTSLHIETGGAPVDIGLADVLAANFSDKPFSVDYFSSNSSPNEAAQSSKGQNMGETAKAGSSAYADGTLTLTDAAGNVGGTSDKAYFWGRSWPGNGVWAFRVKKVDDANPEAQIGLNLRETMDPGSRMFAEAISSDGTEYDAIRKEAGVNASTGKDQESRLDLPVWLRFTRNNGSFQYAISEDGKKWDVREQDYIQQWATTFIGLIANSNGPNQTLGVCDQITFKPVPSESQIISNGVFLRGGTFLSGLFTFLTKNDGTFDREGKPVSVTNDQVTVVTYHPIPVQQIRRNESKTGVILKNNDFMESDIDSLSGAGLNVESLYLGILNLDQNAVLACVVHPLAPAESPYEIRLNDGSVVRAMGVDSTGGQLVLKDFSGASIKIDPNEISQFRAGGKMVQNLSDFGPNKTSPDSKDEAPDAETWQGPNQEQMIIGASGSTLRFTLSGKFRALCFRMALSPDSPVNAQASCQISADGNPLLPILPVKSGEEPRLIYLPLQNPKTLTIQVDSGVQGMGLLIIDPVLVRDDATP